MSTGERYIGKSSSTTILPLVVGLTVGLVLGGCGGDATEPEPEPEPVPNRAPSAVISTPSAGTVVQSGETVTLTGAATDAEDGALAGAALAWSSDRDGALGSGSSLSVALTDGAHSIALVATDSEGATDTSRVDLRVNEAPAASIDAPADSAVFTVGDTVALSGSGTDGEDGDLTGDALAWTSDIDGALGTGPTVAAALSEGTHRVTLTATDSDGGESGTGVRVVMEPNSPPEVAILAPADSSVYVVGDTVTFEGSASDPDGTVTEVLWTSSVDGELRATLAFSAFLSAGTHTVTLTAADDRGAEAQASITVVVTEAPNEPPTASIDAPADGHLVQSGDVVSLWGSASDPEDGSLMGAALTWSSDLDGALGSGTTLPVTLSDGAHTITLVATDGDGAADTAAITVHVNAAPDVAIVAPADSSVYAETDSVAFEASASDGDGTITDVTWSSDLDGTIGTTLVVSTPLSVGTHTVSFVATDDRGGSATASVTVVVEEVPTAWASVTAGGYFSMGLDTAGRSYTWGTGYNGEMGLGAAFVDEYAPIPFAPDTIWTLLTDGSAHACGLVGDRALCWGNGAYGRLGTGSTGDEYVPAAVTGGAGWLSLDAGHEYTCGIRTDGTGLCWGRNESGQLGDGTLTSRTAPTVVAGSRTWSALFAGVRHTCGITTGGDAYCWGVNDYGQLGDGSTTNQRYPVLVAGGHAWAVIAPGNEHTCGITTDGVGLCWGRDDSGQLGNGTGQQSSLVPDTIAGGRAWTEMATGDLTTCGIAEAGDAYCWGYNTDYQTGSGSTASTEETPVLVVGGHTWQTLGAGRRHFCAVTPDHVAYCWGRGAGGALGTGWVTTSAEPVRVAEPTPYEP